MKRLADKIAIVTGAGGGIGGAISRVFAAEGARVACVDVDAAAAEEAADAAHWRETRDGERTALVIADAGLQAIGVDADRKTSKQSSSTKARPKQRSRRAEPKPSGAKPNGRTSPAAVRPGTKQALLIDLLKRKKGATIEKIVEATGWQPHSVRGAISGTLKKKLGLMVTSEKPDDGPRRYRIVAAKS